MFQTFLRRSLIPQITDLQRVLMANGLRLPLFVLVIFMSLGWGERVLFIFSSAAAFKGLSQQVNSSSMTYSRGSSWCYHILCAGIEVLHLFVICLPEQHYHVERLCRSYIAACLFLYLNSAHWRKDQNGFTVVTIWQARAFPSLFSLIFLPFFADVFRCATVPAAVHRSEGAVLHGLLHVRHGYQPDRALSWRGRHAHSL